MKSRVLLASVAAGAGLALVASPLVAHAAPPKPDEIVPVTRGGGALVDDLGGATPSVSADGTKLVFTSSSSFLPDANGKTQFYLKDLVADDIRSLSVGTDGLPANADVTAPVISADGTRVAFLSEATNLVSGFDTYGVVQAYRAGVDPDDLIQAVSVGAKLPVRGTVDLSADGDLVVFSTASALGGVAATDGHDQVYVRSMSFGDTMIVSSKSSKPGTSHSRSSPVPTIWSSATTTS